jgi:EAL and modified HD-GYP domain-containing signal transduction protein
MRAGVSIQATDAPPRLVHVARQPIFDARGQVFGYELLYRAGSGETSCVIPSNIAAARTINTAVVDIGLGTLTAGKLAFINISEELLLSGPAAYLSPDGVVLELLENVAVSESVVAACKRLREAGYTLALDDFVPGSAAETLLPYASYVKVDVLALSQPEIVATAARLSPLGVRLLAEKVETVAARDAASAAGYTLFQGYFFSKPALVSRKAIEPGRLAQMRLVAELNRPGATFGQLADLIEHDGALSVRILRAVNAAAMGKRTAVRSIREALLYLGLDRVRQWASIWSLASLNHRSPEVVTTMVVRAKACELLGAGCDGRNGDSSLFLLGLCSMLDILLDQPFVKVLEYLPVDEEIRSALLGERNQARDVLDAITHYERGDFGPAADCAASLGLPPSSLATAYNTALTWADDLASSAAA